MFTPYCIELLILWTQEEKADNDMKQAAAGEAVAQLQASLRDEKHGRDMSHRAATETTDALSAELNYVRQQHEMTCQQAHANKTRLEAALAEHEAEAAAQQQGASTHIRELLATLKVGPREDLHCESKDGHTRFGEMNESGTGPVSDLCRSGHLKMLLGP